MMIPPLPGSYILFGKLDNEAQFISGPFSNQLITPGYYLYAGSAFGNRRIVRENYQASQPRYQNILAF